MLWRVAEHYVGIKLQTEHKYRLMAEAQRRGYTIKFDVLYYAKSKRKTAIIEEIGKARLLPLAAEDLPKYIRKKDA